jgi:hypothetical protein
MAASSAQINYIRHLNAFFAQVRKDDRLHAHHISLYMALFQVWNQYRFQNPFPVLREEVMSLSRIGSRSTYVGCLKHLHVYQYIIYQPAKHPYAPSLITILTLTDFVADPTPEQLLLFSGAMWPKNEPRNEYETGPHMRPETGPRTRPKSGPRSGPKVGHINNKHINNLKREGENMLPPPKKMEKMKLKKTSSIRVHPARKMHQAPREFSPPYPRYRNFLTPTSTRKWKLTSFSTTTRQTAGDKAARR